MALSAILAASGCYAPLVSPGIPATELPDFYRMPIRTAGEPLNFSALVASPPTEYRLGPGDLLELTIPDLLQGGDANSFQAQVLDNGEIQIPRLGPITVGGMTVAEAQRQIVADLGDGFLADPSVTVSLIEKGTISVVVLGAVKEPGILALPRGQNDVGHALAAAAGFTEDAADAIEIHRQTPIFCEPMPGNDPTHSPLFDGTREPIPPVLMPPSAAGSMGPGFSSGSANPQPQPAPYGDYRSQTISTTQLTGHSSMEPIAVPDATSDPTLDSTVPSYTGIACDPSSITRISLRGADPLALNPANMILGPGDVVVVPNRKQEVFYVVGRLSETNRVRFTVGDRDRQIGNGFLLPPDREVDVITAVAMAGYIDPIDSPTTVTVHRIQPDGQPLLVRVDLIRARSNVQENMLVEPGDIIYLNPDHWWYTRYLFDRIIDRGLGTAASFWITR